MSSTSDFEALSISLREKVIEMTSNARSGHVGCAFSLIEIVSVLYESVLNFNPKNPSDPDRDLLVLSKGHGVLALYAYLAKLGWISQKDVDNYFQDGSRLFGLAEDNISGVEACGGSLGHGLAVAAGMAWAEKIKKSSRRVYCIVGDGELNEGSIWEALMFIGHHQLQNITIVVDCNGLQAMGETHQIIQLESMVAKAEAFGLAAVECDGHSEKSLIDAFEQMSHTNRPGFIVAKTIKGKGVSFMENNNQWHYLKMTDEIAEKSLREIRKGGQ